MNLKRAFDMLSLRSQRDYEKVIFRFGFIHGFSLSGEILNVDFSANHVLVNLETSSPNPGYCVIHGDSISYLQPITKIKDPTLPYTDPFEGEDKPNEIMAEV